MNDSGYTTNGDENSIADVFQNIPDIGVIPQNDEDLHLIDMDPPMLDDQPHADDSSGFSDIDPNDVSNLSLESDSFGSTAVNALNNSINTTSESNNSSLGLGGKKRKKSLKKKRKTKNIKSLKKRRKTNKRKSLKKRRKGKRKGG